MGQLNQLAQLDSASHRQHGQAPSHRLPSQQQSQEQQRLDPRPYRRLTPIRQSADKSTPRRRVLRQNTLH